MKTRQLILTAAVLAFTAAPCLADGPRTGMGPGAGNVRTEPDNPNPVGSPDRAATSIPGAMEHPNAGHKGPMDKSGATESGNARRPAGPGGNAKNSGPGSGAGTP